MSNVSPSLPINNVETYGQDIGRLLALASSCISLLTLPQTDPTDSTLPQGEERSEQFVLEANEYFERLDVCGPSPNATQTETDNRFFSSQQIHISIRSTLAHLRQARIAPSAINAPPMNFLPQPSGVGTPPLDSDGSKVGKAKFALQEERVNRDAWKGALDAMKRLNALQRQSKDTGMMDTSA